MQSFYIAPTSFGVGLTSVTLGLVHALDQAGLRVGYFKPVEQSESIATEDSSFQYLSSFGQYNYCEPLSFEYVKEQLASGKQEQLLEEIVANYEEVANESDVVVIEGLVPSREIHYMNRLNKEISKTLQSDIILVSSADNTTLSEVASKLRIIADMYGGLNHPKMRGYILNKTPENIYQQLCPNDNGLVNNLPQFKRHDFHAVGCIPWQPLLIAPRTSDVARLLNAEILHAGDIQHRRVERRMLCARSAVNVIHNLRPGTLVICPGDREDILLVAAMAAVNGVPLAGVLLTNGVQPDEKLMSLCRKAMGEFDLPLMLTDSSTLR